MGLRTKFASLHLMYSVARLQRATWRTGQLLEFATLVAESQWQDGGLMAGFINDCGKWGVILTCFSISVVPSNDGGTMPIVSCERELLG
jgi:hypothetical protein